MEPMMIPGQIEPGARTSVPSVKQVTRALHAASLTSSSEHQRTWAGTGLMGRLPLELMLHILDYVTCTENMDEDDQHQTPDLSHKAADLRSLCLTSYALSRFVSPILYKTVVLSNPHKAQVFFASSSMNHDMQLHMRYLWCGVLGEVLYDSPHRLACDVRLPAQEVSWMQADADGRYHGFQYSTEATSTESEADSASPFPTSPSSSLLVLSSDPPKPTIRCMHVICPDLGRWAVPLFSHLTSVQHITLSLYPKGNWDLEEAKIELVLRGILAACLELETLHIVVCHTVAAAGSRTVRMTRSIPIAHAVRAVDDDRISVRASDFLFGVHGRSPTEEVIQYTRRFWEERVHGGAGPWPATIPDEG